MGLARRRFLHLAAATAALPAVSRLAQAQPYPAKPITIIVPYLANGPADGLARPLADRMGSALGQTVVIDNVPGESGTIGVARAVRTAPDGYNLSFGHVGSHVINGAIFPLAFDLRTDFEPIALLPSNALTISARKGFPADNLQELIVWLKANPGKATTASAGAGSGTHVNAIYFQNHTGTQLQFVTHKSVQTAIKALIAGELDLLFDQASNSLPHLRSGAIKAYAVTSKERSPSVPDIPSTDEAGLPGFHSTTWYGLWAPKGTPRDIIVRLNTAVTQALNDAALIKRLNEQGLDMPPRDQATPEAFGAFHRAEIEKWWALIKAAGIKAG
jgi:tripartite-type tricarboxylate transporter receptor subunit TctC